MSLERDLPLTYFNPCLREGGDQYGDEYQCNPADFNPRLREGGDFITVPTYFPIPEFQSTPPRRRRHTLPLRLQYPQHFNPRLREGGDISLQLKSLSLI